VMLGTIAAIIVQLGQGDAPRWAAVLSLVLAASAIVTAAVHTVPSAMRLGTRSDTDKGQTRLARSIFRDHLLCITAVAVVLFLQLAFAR